MSDARQGVGFHRNPFIATKVVISFIITKRVEENRNPLTRYAQYVHKKGFSSTYYALTLKNS